MKQCNKCEVTKELDRFSVQSKCKGGRHPTCKDCRNAAHKARYEAGLVKPKQNTYTYAKQLMSRYKLTQAQYDSMLSEQGGKCAICSRADTLVVDHCHSTGKVRGLLCTRCNTALGKFKDSEELLRVAINYLAK